MQSVLLIVKGEERHGALILREGSQLAVELVVAEPVVKYDGW